MDGNRTASHQTLGPYEIRSSLGQGGGGTVYRAWDPRLRREVAVKMLGERTDAHSDRVRRFVAEARAASALNHPNIVTVFDAVVDGDTPYIVSELIDGATLREELRRGPVPLKRLLDLAVQIADGLSAAHDAAIVHRDLKPENIMVTRSGRAKIVDFGLTWTGAVSEGTEAAAVDDSQTLTMLGLLAGTIPYMSPEQARGAATDFHSDQFSFGLMLYEMSTGKPAFRRETPAGTLDAIINDELPPMGALDARAPLLLRWIVERCLAKNPEDRYGSTADLYRDLRTLRDRLAETVAREAGANVPKPAAAWRRVWKAAAIGAALVVSAIAGGSLVDRGRQNPALNFAPLTTTPPYEGFPAWSPNGSMVAYAVELAGVLQIVQRDPLASAATRVTDSAFDCKYPFWSPDGKRIYYVSLAQDREAIWSVLASGGQPQVVVRNANRGAISPDGRTLAFLRDEGQSTVVGSSALYLATVPDGQQWSKEVVEAAATRYGGFGDHRFIEGALAFAPDGRRLGLSAVGGAASRDRWWQFWVVPLPNGQASRRFQALNADTAPRVSSFTWMPDGRHVVLGLTSLSTFKSHLWMADLERDRAWRLTTTPVSEEYPAATSAGNDVALVYTKDDSDYDTLEIALTRGTSRPLLESSRKESDPVWSAHGVLAYVTDRGGQDEIWQRAREGASLVDRPLITQRNFGQDDRTVMLGAPSFSPDGQRIAYLRTGGKPIWPLRIWYSGVAGGSASPLLPLTTAVSFHGAPSWSPDGQWIAFAEWVDDKWRLVKVRVGSEERVELRNDGVSNATPRWSPIDNWITWETAAGFVLVSPDGSREEFVSEDQWHAHTWTRDGSEILGIKDSDDYHLLLVAVEPRRSGRTRIVADLGPSPPANNPVAGLSISVDGQTAVTSVIRLRGDLWLLKGLTVRDERRWWRRWFSQIP